MDALSVPSQCAIALKEWATVLEAMAHGEQMVLIRKGGLIEPGSGFELVSSAFVFYPTFEHQAVNYLRPEYQRYFTEAIQQRAPEGQVRVELIGVAVSSKQTDDPTIVKRLERFHIYNQDFLGQGLKWQSDHPLVIVVVRTFRLPSPCLISVVPRYAGCKSWVDLESPVSLEGAHPVLEESVFRQRAQQLAQLLA